MVSPSLVPGDPRRYPALGTDLFKMPKPRFTISGLLILTAIIAFIVSAWIPRQKIVLRLTTTGTLQLDSQSFEEESKLWQKLFDSIARARSWGIEPIVEIQFPANSNATETIEVVLALDRTVEKTFRSYDSMTGKLLPLVTEDIPPDSLRER